MCACAFANITPKQHLYCTLVLHSGVMLFWCLEFYLLLIFSSNTIIYCLEAFVLCAHNTTHLNEQFACVIINALVECLACTQSQRVALAALACTKQCRLKNGSHSGESSLDAKYHSCQLIRMNGGSGSGGSSSRSPPPKTKKAFMCKLTNALTQQRQRVANIT